jgi:hypothetical protein
MLCHQNTFSFKFMDKQSRFTRDVLFYSGRNIENRGCPGRIACPSGSPANKSRACAANVDAGSNVIDVSERQSKKQYWPMTVTEAGR